MSLLTLYTLFVLLPWLDVMGYVLVALTIVIFAFTLLSSLDGYLEPLSDNHRVIIRKARNWAIFWVLSGLVMTASPDRDEVMYLVGGYFVVNNEEVQKLPTNVLGAANAFLENYKEAFEPKKEAKP